MRRTHAQFRVFKCLNCGNTSVYPKYRYRTKQGHKKTVWCYKCKRKTVQVQISKGGYREDLKVDREMAYSTSLLDRELAQYTGKLFVPREERYR